MLGMQNVRDETLGTQNACTTVEVGSGGTKRLKSSREAAACESPARKCRVRVGKAHESRRDGTGSYAHSLALGKV
jgi:hypothetical protein